MKVVTEENYKQIVFKRMIALCWAFLLVCFIVKIFGGNFFVYLGQSKVVEYIVMHRWLLCLVQAIVYICGTYMIFIILLENKYKFLCLIFSIVMAVGKQLIDLGGIFLTLSFILEFLFLILIPVILHPDKIIYILYVNIVVVLYQIISLVTKSINIVSFPYEDVVGFMYMIDYYIMLLLNSLYIIKGDINTMKLGVWFLSKDKTQLEAYKKVVVEKHEKKIAKIDEKIAKAK